MKDLWVDASAATTPINLGKVGENLVLRLVLDTSVWEHEYPDGRLALFMERPDKRRYVAAAKLSGASWVYDITAADLSIAGRGRMQLQWVVGQRIARSAIVDTMILPSITGCEGPPGYPEAGYLEQMAAIGAQAAKDAERAQKAADGLSGMGAEAVTLGPGSQATVEVKEAPDGGRTLVFGIPKGDEGGGGGDVVELSKDEVNEVLDVLKVKEGGTIA